MNSQTKTAKKENPPSWIPKPGTDTCCLILYCIFYHNVRGWNKLVTVNIDV